MLNFLNKENSILKNDIDINTFFYFQDKDEQEYKQFITQAQASREWMNNEYIKYIYNCQPVVASNQIGWFILQSHEIEVEWNGGPRPEDLKIFKNNQDPYSDTTASHFGSGILSIAFPLLFKTSPGWGLLVGGPSNLFIDGIYPLEGLVETNWSPYPFTMNYKITRRNHRIKIPKYHPICRILPIPLNLNEHINLKYQNINSDKELNDHFIQWSSQRRKINEDRKNLGINTRMNHYKDGINIYGCPFTGMHKMIYKFKNIIG